MATVTWDWVADEEEVTFAVYPLEGKRGERRGRRGGERGKIRGGGDEEGEDDSESLG